MVPELRLARMAIDGQRVHEEQKKGIRECRTPFLQIEGGL
jgi:hypothetical protein